MGMPETIGVYLLESSDGPILFETGPYSCLPYLEKGLSASGYKKEDIKHVFLTHIHLDHAGAAWAFAAHGATIYVHPIGVKHLVDPTKLVSSATKIYGDKMDLLWGQFEPTSKERLVIAEHGQHFEIGNQTIKALHTPGHAVHHIAWNTSAGVVCGDVAGIRIGAGPAMPPCPPPDVNLSHWRESIDILLDEEPNTLFIAHFGRHKNAISHLTALKEEIEEWDQFTFDLYKSTPDPKEALPVFREWIAQRILTISEDKNLLPTYAIANPPWMSIHGLYRYYTKREKAEKEKII